jgi:WD40 repeat protein
MNVDMTTAMEGNVKRTHDVFQDSAMFIKNEEPNSQKLKLEVKFKEYQAYQTLPKHLKLKKKPEKDQSTKVIEQISLENQLSIRQEKEDTQNSSLIRIKESRKMTKPQWHAPWKLKTVISGHVGWVRSISVDPTNEWFASGAGDRLIKIWDLASGTLKLTLTGHIGTVRGVAISERHPYLFSAGEDKQIKCWDMEYNKVIRHYHGHLSGIYSLALHPTLDLLVTGGRDSSARVI